MSLSRKSLILVLSVVMTLLLGPAVSEALGPPAYRITADRNANSFRLGVNEPLQVNVKKGQVRTFSFDKPVTGVISRNPTVANLTVVSGAIEAHGLLPGRTGMRITFEGVPTPLFMGLRVDNADGSLPGLPGPVALGSVSEDGEADLAFWEGHVPGPKGTRMDLRYIYLNNGPFVGWHTWWNRVQNFAANSMLWGMVPFFVFYNIPADKGEGYEIDLRNINSFYYMSAYYANLHLFLKQAKEVMQGELYGIIVEPDFLGYMQQLSGKQPSEITTIDGTLVNTVTSINQIIARKKADGDNIIFGWQLNIWADNASNQKDGTIRRTDDLGWEEGRKVIAQAARNTANYAMSAGALSHGADFLVVDKYGLDGYCIKWGVDGQGNPIRIVNASKYFWNNDHWMNYLLFIKTISEVSQKKVLLWQLPVGHINSSTAISARTNKRFPDLANIDTKWEDSSTTFFFGDVFDVSGDVLEPRTPSPTRISYFRQNYAKDPTLSWSDNRITWGSHINILPQYGIIAAMFGAGIGESTKGTGNPPPDDYFWIQKAQTYYLGLQHKRIVPALQYLLLQ
jgi:hypothetical protein